MDAAHAAVFILKNSYLPGSHTLYFPLRGYLDVTDKNRAWTAGNSIGPAQVWECCRGGRGEDEERGLPGRIMRRAVFASRPATLLLILATWLGAAEGWCGAGGLAVPWLPTPKSRLGYSRISRRNAACRATRMEMRNAAEASEKDEPLSLTSQGLARMRELEYLLESSVREEASCNKKTERERERGGQERMSECLKLERETVVVCMCMCVYVYVCWVNREIYREGETFHLFSPGRCSAQRLSAPPLSRSSPYNASTDA
jgi:hypothetical protein